VLAPGGEMHGANKRFVRHLEAEPSRPLELRERSEFSYEPPTPSFFHDVP
jgi:hypothetical protein